MRSALAVAVALAIVSGCSSEPKKGDAGSVEPARVLDLYAVKQVHAAFSKKLEGFSAPADAKDGKPTVSLTPVTNNSAVHVNSEIVTDELSTALTDSGKFRVIVAERRLGEIKAGENYETAGASADTGPATRFKVDTTAETLHPGGALKVTVVLRDTVSKKAVLESVSELPLK
jgi:PBP1b-binding outer membrane lipoprotein LpoB